MSERLVELIFSGVFVLALIVLACVAPSHLATSVVIVFAILFDGYVFGRHLFPHTNKIMPSVFGIIVILALQSILQTIWYYAGWKLGYQSDAVTLAVGIGMMQGYVYAARSKQQEASDPSPSLRATHHPAKPGPASPGTFLSLLALIPAVLATFFVLTSALAAATNVSIRTPWPLMAPGTLAAIALIFLCSFLVAWRKGSMVVTTIITSLAILSVTLIAPLLYKIGYGFDGFLHRASENILLQTGYLVPKPPYYIGQYVLVTWLARLFRTSIHLFDIFLVPLLAGLIPWTFGDKETGRGYRIAGITLLLPLGLFVATTPQAFAYILGLIAVSLALQTRYVLRATCYVLLPPLLIALWSTITHPLAGLPFLGATLLVLLVERRMLRWGIVAASIVSVPLAFFINSARGGARILWNLQPLFSFSTYLHFLDRLFLFPPTHVALWADWAACVAFLFPLAVFVLSIIACVKHKHRSLWFAFLLLGIGLAFAGAILKTSGEFSFLIDYERGNYADRLFVIAQLMLLFPALHGLSWFLERGLKKSFILTMALLLLLSGWQAANAYLALPRHDATIVGHGWSVGQADRDTVRWIEKDATGKHYTVLANQSVSAAAVEAFGFKRYAGDVFYYPLPTGGPLYEIFLRVTSHEPTREAIQEAARLGKSNLVYVVLNAYWSNVEQTGELLDSIADKSEALHGNRIYRFDVSTSTKR
ncbi:hypothetical protein FJZ48_01050 [Candidatus Uhrbacteria bacterium]|nr:hypothetical protein [Candidatus Uhrbacteria bacterium]